MRLGLRQLYLTPLLENSEVLLWMLFWRHGCCSICMLTLSRVFREPWPDWSVGKAYVNVRLDCMLKSAFEYCLSRFDECQVEVL